MKGNLLVTHHEVQRDYSKDLEGGKERKVDEIRDAKGTECPYDDGHVLTLMVNKQYNKYRDWTLRSLERR